MFSKEELQAAGERGWKKRFDGTEPMYFVSSQPPILTVIKAGLHIIRLTHVPRRFSDDDTYALSQLPEPEQKKAWNEHSAFVCLEFFNDLSRKEERVSDKEVYATLARLAVELGDENCAAIYLQTRKRNVMMPNDGSAEEGLRLLMNRTLPL